jgi:hypothetical protein
MSILRPIPERGGAILGIFEACCYCAGCVPRSRALDARLPLSPADREAMSYNPECGKSCNWVNRDTPDTPLLLARWRAALAAC